MKYKIKVGNKYLVGESVSETLKGTVRGDTTSVYSRLVGEMSAYDFCDNIEDADAKDAVTACDYVRGIMDRQNYGFYPGEIKLIDADAEETVVHCKKEENATFVAMILDADAEGKVWALELPCGICRQTNAICPMWNQSVVPTWNQQYEVTCVANGERKSE